jgi:thioredoxin-like negative regulator of GroEL
MDIARPIPGWSPSTPEVLWSTIDGVVKQHRVVAIHFWAPWDGHDPEMDRNIRTVEPRFEGRVFFASCNIDRDENAQLCRHCGVGNIPALGIIVDGSPRRAIIGVREPESLAHQIESRLRDPQTRPWWAFWRR